MIIPLKLMTIEKTEKEKMMKKNILTPLKIAWLVLAMFTMHNSMLALNSDDRYCAGSACQKDDDCVSPCLCDGSTYICSDYDQSER